jgi:hypothetical protein
MFVEAEYARLQNFNGQQKKFPIETKGCLNSTFAKLKYIC